MPDVDRVREQLTREMETLEFEVKTLAGIFEGNSFFGHPQGFKFAHNGYLMACMSKIDMLSSFLTGQAGSHTGQTKRMTDFMDRYLYPGRVEEHRVAVQLFRHTLMHTGALRFLYDSRTDTRYTWRIYFGDDAIPQRHYTVTDEDPQYQDQLLAPPVSTGSTVSKTKALNLSILRLVVDLKRAVDAYLVDFAADVTLQANFDTALARIIIQEFK